jgi:hypothetical protein
MKKVLGLAMLCVSFSAFAQSTPIMLGTWKGIGNSAVMGAGLFHPAEAGKEKSVRFRHVEHVLVIDKEEGRNFSGHNGATNSKDPTDVKHREVILGAFSRDMKSGVMVNETGNITFKLIDPKNLELCFTRVSTKPKVAACYEMVKQ